jgi:hypothetical protein
MRLEINDDDFHTLNPRMLRAAAYLLLHVIGDIKEDEADPDTAADRAAALPPSERVAPLPPSIPMPPPPPPPYRSESGDEDDETGESNVVNFPVAATSTNLPPVMHPSMSVPPPPPVTSAVSAALNLPVPPTNVAATSAAAVASVASAEVDKNGMPWDERIHQTSKGRKKDGSWKLKKIFDSTPEKESAFAQLVETVTREHAAKRGAAPPVQLPAGGSSMPLPPVSGAVPAPPSNVPAPPPPAGASMPVPPAPSSGPVGASPYTALIDKILSLTKEAKLTHLKVNEMCQLAGAQSLQALSNSPHLVPLVDRNIDAAVLGLM